METIVLLSCHRKLNNKQYRLLISINRETGENPVRSRRRKVFV